MIDLDKKALAHPLSDRAFIDWDGWLWDRDSAGKVFLVAKDGEAWLAGYRAALTSTAEQGEK